MITYREAMVKTAGLTEGQRTLLLFLLATGGGTGVGAYLDREKPLRGGIIGAMAGATGHAATFIKPQALDKMTPEARMILAGTGAVGGAAGGGFLGKNLYQAYENVLADPPEAPAAEKTAMEKRALQGPSVLGYVAGSALLDPERPKDMTFLQKFNPSALWSGEAWGALPGSAASGMGRLSRGAAEAGGKLTKDVVDSFSEGLVGIRPIQKMREVSEKGGELLNDLLKLRNDAKGWGDNLKKWAPLAVGGMGLLGAGLLASQLFRALRGGGDQPPQGGYRQYARGPDSPYVQGPSYDGKFEPNRWVG